MVKRLILAIIIPVFFSSCAFFGSSAFPAATSMDLGWFRSFDDINSFYILDNGVDEPLLVITGNNLDPNGNRRILIFDTALNIRQYITPFQENDNNPIYLSDGLGYVDHDGNYVIGNIVLSSQGTIDETTTYKSYPFPSSESFTIFPYTDSSDQKFYIRIESLSGLGYTEVYDETWNWVSTSANGFGTNEVFVIPQSDFSSGDVNIVLNYSDVYSFSIKELYENGMNNQSLNLTTPVFNATNPEYSQWATRCDRGIFLSDTGSGDIVLLDSSGVEIERSHPNHSYGKIVTIDYDSDYYYKIVEDGDSYIMKERVPF
ncbi:hypothetical protein [Spirochaeta isovalerica]|uniref:Lipoprotein n=1 Tax=Spirochaeta isovalerica TaxID=150 RepID=A0A841R3M0_9SPIO|nr:hypothetical protein [Spirochaeta isovalerica]MBB6478416.1 hypothetical protein [Spirochaeta isovalerica]